MASAFSVIKTLVVPAVISLLLFVLTSYVLLPLWQRYRNRYSHYLPLETISTQTSSLRVRVQNAVAGWVVPSTWRQRLSDRLVIHASDIDYNSEEGEELGDVLDGDEESRELSNGPDHTRRLSRDLEEGFRDDSDEENEGA